MPYAEAYRRNDVMPKTVAKDQRATERLCVVFADMIGYSALSSADELGTHRMWMDFIASSVMQAAKQHEAKIIRLVGDGCLLSFKLPGQAIGWCLDVRSAVIEDRQGASARWQNLSLRFAVHVCDVIHEDGDIYGDGVNITKRLQERAEGDGLLISEATRQELGSEVRKHNLRYLGELEYKNIGSPVGTYEFIFPNRSIAKRKAEKNAPAIAIMPFANASGGQEFDYFCEGVIDDIIQSLASLKELQVIARSSTLPFAGRQMDSRDVARILSVRYVLQGSLRIMGDCLRLSVTLEDAKTGETILGEKCDFSHSAIFEVQDNIVRQIVARITPEVRALELETALRKPPANFTAYQCLLRALDLMKELNRENFEKARNFLLKSHELDDQFALALAWLVRWYCIMLGQRWIENRDEALAEAQDYAKLAMSLDRDNPMVLASFAHLKSYLQRDYETAIVYYDRARQVSPSNALVWVLSSATLSYLGKGEEAVEHARMALKLSPNDPDLYQFYDFASIAHMTNGEYEEALTWANLSHSENPFYTSNLKVLIVLNNRLGNHESARKFADQLLRLEPDFSCGAYKDQSPLRGRVDAGDTLEGHRFANDLQAAGLPN